MKYPYIYQRGLDNEFKNTLNSELEQEEIEEL